MKVLFVPPMSYPLHMGGFESQVMHIYKELIELGIDVDWYNLSNTEIRQYDIIHLHSSVTEFLPIVQKAKELSKKIVVTPMIGSPRYSNKSYQFKLLASRFPGLFYVMKRFNQIFSMADCFIALTNFEKNRLRTIFKIDKEISIIPNGIDDSFFCQDDTFIKLPFTNYIIVVGRIEPDKNQLPLIEIANELQLNLLIVGEPGIGQQDYYQRCKNIAGNNVVFGGKETNPNIMRQLYKGAYLTAIPSVTEMLPLVIFESLSQHTPVLCTTHCGIYPERVPGLFYTKPIKEKILENIKGIWNSWSSVDIGRKGIYSWNNIAKQHITVYQKLVSE